MNLTELTDKSALQWPQKPALIDGETVVTYAELQQRIDGLAARFQALSLPGGVRVGLRLPNSINYVALTYALWRVNAVVVPIPMELDDEHAATLSHSMRLGAIVSGHPNESSMPLAADVFLAILPLTGTVDQPGRNLAFIRFTSGTTSACKGVALSHETIRDRILASNKTLGIRTEDTVIWNLPMSHHFLVTIVLYLSVGATVVLVQHVQAQPYLEAVQRWRGTVLYAAPFHYALLARDNSGAKLETVRLAVSTTCVLPPAVATDFEGRFGRNLTQALGVIELGLVCVNDRPWIRWDSVGKPQPDYSLRIRNPDRDGYGEVEFAGPGFFDAYADPWTPRETVMPEGWFPTGDIGRLDPQGYLYLVGRKAAVINMAGRKVFPEEIEAVLNRHPAVLESRVFGVPHRYLGEVVEAEVVLKTEARPDDLRNFCLTHLTVEKVPGRIHLVSAIAKTTVTGKIRRPGATAPA